MLKLKIYGRIAKNGDFMYNIEGQRILFGKLADASCAERKCAAAKRCLVKHPQKVYSLGKQVIRRRSKPAVQRRRHEHGL